LRESPRRCRTRSSQSTRMLGTSPSR